MAKPKVFVIHHCAHNKGDRAVLYSVLRELARNGQEDVIVSASDRGYQANAAQAGVSKVEYVTWGWNVERLPVMTGRAFLGRARQAFYYRFAFPRMQEKLLGGKRLRWVSAICSSGFAAAAKAADIVISTGGHHLLTSGGSDGVGPQMFDAGVVAAMQKRLVFWSQSVGPFCFADPRNEQTVQAILQRAERLYVRDDDSVQILKRMQIPSSKIRRTFESVMALQDLFERPRLATEKPPLLGMAIYIQPHGWSGRDRSGDEHRAYVVTMAAVVDHVAARGWRVRFFPHELKGSLADDRSCIQQIIATSNTPAACEIVDEDLEPPDHLAKVRECRLMIGHKTHSVVFALAASVPVIALAYHPKFMGFMRDYGVEEFCLDDRQLSASAVIDLLEKAVPVLDSVSEREHSAGLQISARVQADFRELLSGI